MRILCIDAGNTRIKQVVYTLKNGVIDSHQIAVALREDIESVDLTQWGALDGIVGGCGRPDDRDWLREQAAAIGAGERLFMPRHGEALPFEYVYTGGAPGPDRLANVAAIRALSSGHGAIAIDCGTATNTVVVDGAGEFLGGSIMPGLGTQARSLHEKTGGVLPVPGRLQEPSRQGPVTFPALSTEGAIEAGVLLGHAGAIQALIQHGEKHLGGSLAVFLTGGWSEQVQEFLPAAIWEPMLTTRGLLELGLWWNSKKT